MFEGVQPGTLKIWLLIAAALYLLLPYDLIPDFLGLPGRIDDVALMAWLAWLYRSRMSSRGEAESPGQPGQSGAGSGSQDSRRSQHARQSRHSHQERAHQERESKRSRSGPRPGGDDTRAPDAYTVLGVPPSASPEEIRAAYRARMQEYHPDKVAHLGAELQQLALEKSQQIQRAYHQLQHAGTAAGGTSHGTRSG